jgi:hypothetical protein
MTINYDVGSEQCCLGLDKNELINLKVMLIDLDPARNPKAQQTIDVINGILKLMVNK